MARISSSGQYSGQIGLPDGRMAGSSITSHSSMLPFSTAAFTARPVRSRFDHRVITMTIAAPGWTRCLGPEVYHSKTLS